MKRWTRSSVLLVVLSATVAMAISMARPAFAVAGDLDDSFSGDGRQTTPSPTGYSFGARVTVDAMDRIVVATTAGSKSTDAIVLRYRTGGTLDPNFGVGGIATLETTGNNSFHDVAMDGNKIVAVGGNGSHMLVAKFNADGTPDTSFGGGDGIVLVKFGLPGHYLYSTAAAVSVFHFFTTRIVVAGTVGIGDGRHVGVARLMDNGDPDTGFGGDSEAEVNWNDTSGDVSDALYDVVASPLAVILAGGTAGATKVALAQLDNNGAPDPAFGGDGKVELDLAGGYELAIAASTGPDGLVIGGSIQNLNTSAYDMFVARITPDGGLDSSFSGDGKVLVDFGSATEAGYDVRALSSGKILVVGRTGDSPNWRFALARLRSNGTLDPTFSGDGKVTTNFTTGQDVATGLAVDSQARLVLAGNAGSDIAVARYLSA